MTTKLYNPILHTLEEIVKYFVAVIKKQNTW